MVALDLQMQLFVYVIV